MKNKLKKIIIRIREFLPSWVNFKNILFLLVFLVFISIIIWSESFSQIFSADGMASGAQTPTQALLAGTPIPPVPEELLRTEDQTDGVILGAIIIILTIIIGTISILIRDRE
jgi:uncharacterized membrane protein SpoIIM required for sporulation